MNQISSHLQQPHSYVKVKMSSLSPVYPLLGYCMVLANYAVESYEEMSLDFARNNTQPLTESQKVLTEARGPEESCDGSASCSGSQ